MSETDLKSDKTSASEPSDPRAACLSRLEVFGEDAGYFEPLGDHHWAVFSDDCPTLLVTFESLENIMACDAGTMPFCHSLATNNGWSHLCIINEGESWYRDKAVYRYLDRLVDDAFFEDFDQVVFYGAGMAAYAACAFSVVAPGATVLAIQPRATLDPSVAGWDNRNRNRRRLNFTNRYGYAPDMVEGTGEVFIFYDPLEAEDAMHAALFNRPNVTKLTTRFMGPEVAEALGEAKLLSPLVQAAAEGKLTKASFAKIWRARRSNVRYLRGILLANAAAGHPEREAMICRSVIKRLRAPGFRRHLAELEEKGAVRPAPDPTPKPATL